MNEIISPFRIHLKRHIVVQIIGVVYISLPFAAIIQRVQGATHDERVGYFRGAVDVQDVPSVHNRQVPKLQIKSTLTVIYSLLHKWMS